MTVRNPTSEAEAVTMFRPYVLKEANRFASSGSISKDDLIQEGCIALAMAFRSWKPDGGANFLTWIRKPVHYAMLRVVRDQRRGGGAFRGGARDANKVTDVRLVSMDAPLDEVGDIDLADGEGTLHDVMGTFDDPVDELARERLPDLVSDLDERERKVIRMRFEGGMTHAQIGRRLGVSRERIRQIETEALERLKARLQGEEAS